jgi:hypothetical protein
MLVPNWKSCAWVLAMVSGTALGQSGPPPIPPVQSVTPMGIVTQDPLVQGRDNTFSAEINGISYWVFGDTTLTQDNASGTNFFSNSMAWATDLDASNGIDLNGNYLDSSGAPAEFMPFLAWESSYNAAHSSSNCTATPCGANIALWPAAIVPDPARNRALIFFLEIWRTPGVSGWTQMGAGVVIWKNGKFTRPVVSPGTQYPTLLFQGTQVAFISGWVVIGETLYLYGNQSEFLSENTQVAKVKLADVTKLSDWSYYVGNGTWSSSASDAVAVFNGGDAGSSVFYDSYLGMYVAVYCGVEDDNWYYNVAYQPWGPWSAPTQFYVGLPGYENNADYACLAHPEFSSGNGQTQYLTYVQDTGFLAQQVQLLQLVFGPPATSPSPK